MIEITTTQLMSWVSVFMWPLVRILGLFTTAPVLSNRSLPVRVRLGLGIAIAALVAPGLPAGPVQDPLSWEALLIVIQQFLIGTAIGFVIRLLFSGVELAGEMIGMSMGLGFATFFDPTSQGRTSVVNQLIMQLTLMLFLLTDLHLLLIDSVVDSFQSLPISATPTNRDGWSQLVYWGSRIFSIGLQLSLPIVTALLITNLALGVLTRAAPQLNVFSIGFPVTLLVGILMLGLTLPYWSPPLLDVLQDGLALVREFTLALSAP